MALDAPNPESAQETEPATGARSTFEKTLGSVIGVGREILASRLNPLGKDRTVEDLVELCRELIDHRGEASGLALASEVADRIRQLEGAEQLLFFQQLASEFEVDGEAILKAAETYRDSQQVEDLWAVARTVEAPRQKLFRRINMAPSGTATLVALRGDLLPLLRIHPELRGVDSDLKHLFVSWFNKGFLELRRIDWSSPANVLERIIDYEAVHEINGWEDLRSRLRDDRRCFAFFHPALENDPLVFVEIALTDHIPEAIDPLLDFERESPPPDKVSTVVFYSISNCHPGLAGVSFGNFLIKNVVEELKQELPGLKTFVTLSPVPGYRRWLADADLTPWISEDLVEKVREPIGQVVETEVYEAHLKLCAAYLLKARSGEQPMDPVARFHLGNGARLHRLHGNADRSVKGRKQSAGIMVNYLYDLSKIEVNHEAYFDQGKISASRAVSKLLG